MSSNAMTNGYTTSCLIFGAKQIVTVVSNGEKYVRGAESMKRVGLLEEDQSRGQLMVVLLNGKIRFVGYEDQSLFNAYRDLEFNKKINATGCCILPGFIDSHSHPIWAGDRVHEFQMKLAGASYMEIHEAGGGIHFTVQQTKQANEDELHKLLLKRLHAATKCGTTFMECKTGYGLDWDTEYKLLKVLTKTNRDSLNIKPGLSITYLAAHAVPINKTSEEATQEIIENQLPRLCSLVQSKELDVHNVDAFCEIGVFDVEQSKAILQAGKAIGLQVNFHGAELSAINSVEMGVSIGAKAISHLEEISDHEISLMANSETVGILLPTTAYMLRLKQPPARKMIDSGCIVALGSDFNPNAYCYSMPLTMHLACVNLNMSLSEALIASTINSAFALGVANTRGSIEIGKQGDFVIINAEKWEHVVYQMGCHDSLIRFVIINGEIVHSKI